MRPSGSDANWWHTGILGGTYALLVRAYNHTSWVVLVNGGDTSGAFINALDSGMWTALNGVTEWPSIDQFPNYR